MATIKPPTLLFSFLFMAFLSLTSCQFLANTFLKTTGNMKKAKYETPASVIAYLKKQDAEYDGSYIFRDKYKMKYFLDTIYDALPGIVVFDKDYKNIIKDYKCFSSKPTGLDSLINSGSWKKNDNQLHLKLLEQLTVIDSAAGINNKSYDFYVFYMWAKFFPKKSNEMIQENNALYRNFHERIYIGSINMDLQESWK